MTSSSEHFEVKQNGSEYMDRIPGPLRDIFLASNAGKTVNHVPPNKLAMKTFKWLRGRRVQIELRPKKKKDTKRGTPSRDEPQQRKVERSPSLPMELEVPNTATKNHISPQTYLTSLLKNRGYSTDEYKATETGFWNNPNPLQRASYGLTFSDALKQGDLITAKQMLEVGLSPNACNEFGETVIHMACRLGCYKSLRLLLDYGADVQVCDAFGRTPLHDACWATEPCFKVVDMLIEQDARLFYYADCRGALPLQYLKAGNWTPWTKYLMSRKDRFWPDRDIKKVGLQAKPVLAGMPAQSKPLKDPENPPGLELASFVATGRLNASEALFIKITGCDEDIEGSLSGDDLTEAVSETESNSSDWEDGPLFGDDNQSAGTFDEDEMEQLLGMLGGETPAFRDTASYSGGVPVVISCE